MKSNIVTMLAAYCAAIAVEAQAIPVIDQDILYSKDPANIYLASAFGGRIWITQSLTAGLTGHLVRLDLQVAAMRTSDLRVRFGAGEFTDPAFVLLWQGDVPRAALPDRAALEAGALTSIDLSSAGLSLVRGGDYSITLTSTDEGGPAGGFLWVIGEVDAAGNQFLNPPYSGGAAQGSIDAGVTWTPRSVDRPFRTWILPVPEPAGWALLPIGLALAAGLARRRAAHPG